jgi:hypothetical protein
VSINFRPTDRLVEATAKPLGQDVPEPIHERLKQLCDLVYEAGEPRRPTKQEMVAAVIFGSPTTPEELIDLLRRYGRATVADAFLPSQAPTGSVISLPKRTSGPRSPRGR